MSHRCPHPVGLIIGTRSGFEIAAAFLAQLFRPEQLVHVPRRLQAQRADFVAAGITVDKLATSRVLVHVAHLDALSLAFGKLNASCAVIFEEDVVVEPSFAEGAAWVSATRQAMAQLPADWHLLNLGRCWAWCAKERFVSSRIVAHDWPVCRHAYAVSREGAELLRRKTLPMRSAGDTSIRALLISGQIRGFSAAPRIFTRKKSATGSSHNHSKDLPACRDVQESSQVTRAAYFEFSMVHQEVMPSFRAAFAALGWSATFYVLPSRMPGEAHSAFPAAAVPTPANTPHFLMNAGRFNITFRPLAVHDEHRATAGWRPSAEHMHYDVLILGTAGVPAWRAAFLGAFARARGTLVLVEHHVGTTLPLPVLSVPARSPPLVGTLGSSHQHRHFHQLVLGRPPPSAAQQFGAAASVSTSSWHTWYAVSSRQPRAASKPRSAARFCVVGSISSRRRNYDALLEAMKLLHDEGHHFIVDLIGRYSHAQSPYMPRSQSLDGPTVEAKANAMGLARHLEWPTHEYTDAEVASRLERCTHLLPLIDDTFSHNYFGNSTSASIAHVAQSLCIPIMHERLAREHAIDFGYTYKGASPLSPMRDAIVTPDWTMYKATEQYRRSQLEHNLGLLVNLSAGAH